MARPPRTRQAAEADQAVWAAYARSVRPLPGKPALADIAETVTKTEIKPRGGTPAPSAKKLAPAQAAITVGAAPGGLDASTWGKFKGGKLAPQRRLDLHGRTLQAASLALRHFLHESVAARVRCVDIITGHGMRSGGGGIRRELPYWLNDPGLRAMVLAATHPDDNPGVTRLLLRRVRG